MSILEGLDITRLEARVTALKTQLAQANGAIEVWQREAQSAMEFQRQTEVELDKLKAQLAAIRGEETK